MANRTLHLIVTDYDLSGFVREYHLDKIWTPKLIEAVDNLNLEANLSAICYTLFSDETVEKMNEAEILPMDIWRYRAKEYVDPYRRPDDHFSFRYAQRREGLGVHGAIPWVCRIQGSYNDRKEKIDRWTDEVTTFQNVLEGDLLSQRHGSKVGAVIDCTDHPLMYDFLKGLGYDVKRQEVFYRGPWPERK